MDKQFAKAEALREAALLARSCWNGTTNLPLPWDRETAASFDVWLEYLADHVEESASKGARLWTTPTASSGVFAEAKASGDVLNPAPRRGW